MHFRLLDPKMNIDHKNTITNEFVLWGASQKAPLHELTQTNPRFYIAVTEGIPPGFKQTKSFHTCNMQSRTAIITVNSVEIIFWESFSQKICFHAVPKTSMSFLPADL